MISYYHYINLLVNSIPVARLIFDRILGSQNRQRDEKKILIFFFFFVSQRDARAIVNLVFICIATGTAVAVTFNLDREYLKPPHGHMGDITRMIVLLLFLSFQVGGGLSPERINILLLLIPTLFLYNV